MEILRKIQHNPLFLTVNGILLFVLLNLVASGSRLSIDLSDDGINSLSGSTERVLARVEDKVLLEAYISTDLPGEIVTLLEPVMSVLRSLEREGDGKIMLRIVNPDTPEKIREAEEKGIRGIPVEESSISSVSQKLAYFGVFVKMGDKSTVIPLVHEGGIVSDFEYRFLRELKSMLRSSPYSSTGFARGNELFDSRPWRSYQDQSQDNQYAFFTLLEKEEGQIHNVDISSEIPRNIKTLIVTGTPSVSETEGEVLDHFLSRGGKLLMLIGSLDLRLQDPAPAYAGMMSGGQSGGFASRNENRLNAINHWLGKYGVSLNGHMLLEPTIAVPAMDIQGQYLVPIPNPTWAIYAREDDTLLSGLVAHRDMSQFVMPWFEGLDIKEARLPHARYDVLLQSTPQAVSRDYVSLDLKSLQNTGLAPGEERTGRNVPLAVLVRGDLSKTGGITQAESAPEKEGALAVIASPYVVSDIFFRSQSNQQIFAINQAFILNLLEEMSGDTDLTEVRSRVRTLHVLGQTDPGFETFFTWFFVLFFPFILVSYGTYRLWHRNARRGTEQENKTEGAA